jgi:protein-tyrosine phosphatase
MSGKLLVDLHNHLLPGVDDGSRATAESLEYLVRWALDGVAAVTFTPHLVLPELPTADAIDARLEYLSDAFEAFLYHSSGRADLPRLALGQEVCARNGEQMARVASNPRVGLGGTEYILVELGFSPGYDALGVIEAGRAAGRRIVLAHPERYAYTWTGSPMDEIRRWRDAGAYLQVNGGSLQGNYTNAALTIGQQLVLDDLVTIIASDNHGNARPENPSRIFSTLVGLVGAERAHTLMSERPARIRDGKPIENAPAVPAHATKVA